MMAECPICGKKTAIYWPQFYVYRRGKKFFCGADCAEVYDMQRFRARTGWKPRKAVKPSSKMTTKTHQKCKTQPTTQERKKETMKRNKLTLEQKKKAMEIYQAGGDATGYLKECGQKNPYAALEYLKKSMEKKGKATVETAVALPAEARPKKPVPVNGGEWEKPETPETPEEPTLADAMQGMQDAADRFFGACEEAGVTMTAQEVSAKGIEGIPASIDLESGKVTTERVEQPALTGSFRIRTLEGRFGTYDVYTDKEGTTMFSFSNEKGDEVQMSGAKWKDWLGEVCRAAQILGVAL